MNDLRCQLKEVLKHLEDGEWHQIFSIHDRFRLSPDVIQDCINYLESKRLVVSKERSVRIANDFSQEQIAEIVHIYLSSEFEINEDEKFFVTPKIEIDTLYMPRFDLLGKELLICDE